MAGSGVRRHQKRKKNVFLIGIQRGRLAATVRAGKARFGLELAGKKPWRDQVFGSKQGARKKRKVFFFNRDSEGAFRNDNAIRIRMRS